MKRWLLAGALAYAAAGQALASDLPPPAVPPPARAPAAYIPPAVAAVYNWGGIYFGFNLGFGFGTSNWSDPLNISGVTSTGNFNLTGFLAGPTVGGFRRLLDRWQEVQPVLQQCGFWRRSAM